MTVVYNRDICVDDAIKLIQITNAKNITAKGTLDKPVALVKSSPEIIIDLIKTYFDEHYFFRNEMSGKYSLETISSGALSYKISLCSKSRDTNQLTCEFEISYITELPKPQDDSESEDQINLPYLLEKEKRFWDDYKRLPKIIAGKMDGAVESKPAQGVLTLLKAAYRALIGKDI